MQTIQIIKKDNYAILQLDRGKGNPINMEMMGEMTEAMELLKNDAEVRGVVLTGKAPIFSVGLDVKELIMLDREGTTTFFQSFKRMVAAMASFPKLMVASITGHSPAGGCVMALCCDYRVMGEGPFTIGLNEIPVGIMINPFIFGMYSFWIGERQAYHNFLDGKLCTPEEAKAMGLVDAVVPLEEVQETAEQKLKQWLLHDHDTVVGAKFNVRKPLLDKWSELSGHPDLIDTNEHFWKETSREVMTKVIMAFAAKKF